MGAKEIRKHLRKGTVTEGTDEDRGRAGGSKVSAKVNWVGAGLPTKWGLTCCCWLRETRASPLARYEACIARVVGSDL